MRSAARATAVLVAAAAVLAGCSGGGDEPDAGPSTPPGFEAPEGVKLTEPGEPVAPRTDQTFVVEMGEGGGSAVTARLTAVKKGKISDFTFFTLDAASKASTPYYVTASLTNRGPGGIGGVAAPFVARDDSDTVFPPNTLNGTFRPCPTRTLPKSLLPGKKAEVCMVFLVPKGRTLVSIDSAAPDPRDAVRWKAS